METQEHIVAFQEGGNPALTRDASELVERFLLEADIAESTRESYRKALRQFFMWREAVGTRDLSRADILRYKQDQLARVQSSTVGAYISALKSFFKWLEAERLYPICAYLALRESREKDEPLFTSLSNKSYGRRLTTRSLRRIAKGALRKAGFDDPRLTAHSMRHSAITLALLGGASLQQAQALARHSNINTTLIYSHNIDRVNDAAEFNISQMLESN